LYVSYLRVLVLFFLVALRALLVSMSFLFLPFLSVPVAYLDYCIPCYVKGSVLFVYLFVALFLSVLLQCVWPCFPSFFLVFQTLLFGISIFHWILFVVRMVWLYSFRALLFFAIYPSVSRIVSISASWAFSLVLVGGCRFGNLSVVSRRFLFYRYFLYIAPSVFL